MQQEIRWLKRVLLFMGMACVLTISTMPPSRTDVHGVGATAMGPRQDCKDTVCG